MVDVTGEDPRLAGVREHLANGLPLAGRDLSGLTFTQDDLSGEVPPDFSEADLRGATFAGINLASARFIDADLSGAAFHNASAERASFDRCSARGAVFTDVNLAYSSFADADLRGALFFDANMADISFKGASLDGSEVDAIRLSLNGGTHVLGLKEALRALSEGASYPYISGVSGDAFWISYFQKTQDIHWGGFAKDALRRGLENFGFQCSFVDEPHEAAAWEALTAAVAEGATIITPLHVSASTVLGAGFGGAEWVFVTGLDRGEVLVNCMLGDGLRFSPQRFRDGWCQHHPLEEAADDLPVIYAMCIVGPRERTPTRRETARAGLQAAVDVLTLPSTEKVAFGFDAYRVLATQLHAHRTPRDLPPEELRRFLPWLGLGMVHHHGSRWAIRDFLRELLDRGDFEGGEFTALKEAHELYEGVMRDLQVFIEILPWSFDIPDEAERQTAFTQFEDNRERGADLLRAAAARERDALERFKAIIEPR